MDALGVPPDWEPLPADIVTSIEAQLAEALAPIKDLFTPEDPLRINKHHIATVHGCEKYHVLNRQSQFAWNINTVRGTMAHKAIELLINWRGPVIPSEIVDAAITSVAENPRESASDFIISLPAHELAELRGAVVGAVSNFLECFPPIRPQWRPLVEYSASYSLFGGAVLFTSRMDLVLGHPGRKVIIDLKTGRLTPTHRDDLRFLLVNETIQQAAVLFAHADEAERELFAGPGEAGRRALDLAVEFVELLSIVECLTHRVGQGRMLTKDVQF